MTKSIIYIDKYKKSNGDIETGMIGEFVKIDKIVWSMAGREVYEYSSSDEYRLENALFFNGAYGVNTADSTTTSANDQNIYTHRWEISAEKNRFSGAVSGKGVSDMKATVYFTPSSGGTYRVNCVHKYLNIVSISGASGKIGVSLSL